MKIERPRLGGVFLSVVRPSHVRRRGDSFFSQAAGEPEIKSQCTTVSPFASENLPKFKKKKRLFLSNEKVPQTKMFKS